MDGIEQYAAEIIDAIYGQMNTICGLVTGSEYHLVEIDLELSELYHNENNIGSTPDTIL